MSSRYGILCILLFFIVLILGYENYETWSSPSIITSKRVPGKMGETKPDLPTQGMAPKETVPREVFNAIVEKNLFNPERREFSTTEAAAAAMAKPITRPQISLYGVVISEDYQFASIINPGRPLHKGERETKTIKVGDMVGAYKLTKITPDRIVMEADGDSFEVLLYDPKAPKRRVEIRTPTQAATITSVLPDPTPPEMTPSSSPSLSPAVTPPPPAQPAPAPRPAAPRPRPGIPGTAAEGTS